MKAADVHDHYDAVRNDLLATGAVSDMAESSGSITQSAPTFGGFEWKGKDPQLPGQFC